MCHIEEEEEKILLQINFVKKPDVSSLFCDEGRLHVFSAIYNLVVTLHLVRLFCCLSV